MSPKHPVTYDGGDNTVGTDYGVPDGGLVGDHTKRMRAKKLIMAKIKSNAIWTMSFIVCPTTLMLHRV